MTDERRILLLSSPRNHAGFPSQSFPGGTPKELADELTQLREEGLLSLSQGSVVGITEQGKQFLRTRGVAYVPEVPLSQLGELLKLSPQQPSDLQNIYADRARFLVGEVATYLQEQQGCGEVREDLSQCFGRLRSEVEMLFVPNAKPAHEANRERAIDTVATLRNMLTAGKTPPKP